MSTRTKLTTALFLLAAAACLIHCFASYELSPESLPVSDASAPDAASGDETDGAGGQAASDGSGGASGEEGGCGLSTAACRECMDIALDGGCSALASACDANSKCSALSSCLRTCDGGSCPRNCIGGYSTGAVDYFGLQGCVFVRACHRHCLCPGCAFGFADKPLCRTCMDNDPTCGPRCVECEGDLVCASKEACFGVCAAEDSDCRGNCITLLGTGDGNLLSQLAWCAKQPDKCAPSCGDI
jgi:hypothetical protein